MFKKSLFYILCVICVLNCVACSKKYENTETVVLSISENDDVEKKVTIDDFFLISLSEMTIFESNEISKVLLKNSNEDTIGGIDKYIYRDSTLPSLIDPEIDYFQLLNSIGIDIDSDELVAYTFNTGLYHGWEVWLFSDNMDTTHNLIP